MAIVSKAFVGAFIENWQNHTTESFLAHVGTVFEEENCAFHIACVGSRTAGRIVLFWHRFQGSVVAILFFEIMSVRV